MSTVRTRCFWLAAPVAIAGRARYGDFWITMDEYGVATLRGAPEFHRQRNEDGSWGLAVTGAGLASVEQPRPMQVEIGDEALGEVRTLGGGYATLTQTERDWNGTGRLTLDRGAAIDFQDRWEFQGDTLRLERTVRVHGHAPGGFLSAALLRVKEPRAWPDVQWFAPGMIYGGFEHLSPAAIGGRAQYRPGAYAVRIREDRLPAPLLAPPRGQGLHRLWLPWVATSQLNGIFGLMDFDPQLFADLAARP